MTTGADVAGVTDVQRNLFVRRLFARMIPLVRSGRLGRHHLQQYRATLTSAPIPAWLRADSETVLAAISQAVQNPRYQFDQDLAGDFGGLSGILDWVSDAASTVWGAAKEIVPVVTDWAGGGAEEPLPIRVTSPAYAPDGTVAPSPDAGYVPSVPSALPFGLTPLTLGAIALGAFLLLRR